MRADRHDVSIKSKALLGRGRFSWSDVSEEDETEENNGKKPSNKHALIFSKLAEINQ
jgi:hypothetical protein